jgi:dodecin
MSVVKVIEIISEGDSVDEAIKSAAAEASKTLQHIKQVDVKHIDALVENGKVTKFRVNCKVSFVVNHHK